MGGVAGEEQPAPRISGPEAFGDQGEAGGPRGAEQDVERDLPAHAVGEHAPDVVAGERGFVLAGQELGVEDEFRNDRPARS